MLKAEGIICMSSLHRMWALGNCTPRGSGVCGAAAKVGPGVWGVLVSGFTVAAATSQPWGRKWEQDGGGGGIEGRTDSSFSGNIRRQRRQQQVQVQVEAADGKQRQQFQTICIQWHQHMHAQEGEEVASGCLSLAVSAPILEHNPSGPPICHHICSLECGGLQFFNKSCVHHERKRRAAVSWPLTSSSPMRPIQGRFMLFFSPLCGFEALLWSCIWIVLKVAVQIRFDGAKFKMLEQQQVTKHTEISS